MGGFSKNILQTDFHGNFLRRDLRHVKKWVVADMSSE